VNGISMNYEQQGTRAMGAQDRLMSARPPSQNGYAEELIGSIRRECLDHIVIFGEQHLRHLLNCREYYNDRRTDPFGGHRIQAISYKYAGLKCSKKFTLRISARPRSG
jgi:hypothetical protein